MIFAAGWGSFTQSQLHGSCCWNRTQGARVMSQAIAEKSFWGLVILAKSLVSQGTNCDFLSLFFVTL